MPVLYENYLATLLEGHEWNTIYRYQNHHIGFQYRGYNGLVANNGNIQRPQQGLFDFYIFTTTRYERLFGIKAPTHYNLLRDLTMHSCLDNCEEVWHGDTLIQDITDNPNEIAALTILSLMMFEQEVNYGDEDFQQFTQFSPSRNMRPRDMLMGFTRLAFLSNIDDYPYWDRGSGREPKRYPDFNGSFNNLEIEFKQHFNYYTQNHENVLALLRHQPSREKLLQKASNSPNNPRYTYN